MLSRSESKYIQTLSHKKQRDAEGLFIVEGPKLVEELLNSNYNISKIYKSFKISELKRLNSIIIFIKYFI